MLRASIPAAGTHPRVAVLESLVDAVFEGDAARAGAARAAVFTELGPAWLVDACAVIANFEMMTRLADGTGARLRPQQLEAAAGIIDALGLGELTSART
jgi:hypothetical protein